MAAIYADPQENPNSTGGGLDRWRYRKPYDTTNILLGQLLEGENPIGRPLWALSPKEREGIRGRILQGSQNPVAGLLVDLASDPFVWLSLAFHVPLPRANVAWQVTKDMNAALMKKGSFLQGISWETAQQELAGTSLSEALYGAYKGQMEVAKAAESVVEPARQAYMRANGLKGMTPEDARVVAASLAGKGKTQERTYFRKLETEGGLQVTTQKVVEGKWAEQRVFDRYMASRPGLREYHDALRKWYDTSGQFSGLDDPEAMARVYRGISNNSLTGARGKGEGLTAIKELMGEDVAALAGEGRVTEEQFRAAMKAMSPKLTDYHPLNVADWVAERGGATRLLTPSEVREMQAAKRAFAPTPNVVGRTYRPHTYHVEDLEGLANDLGAFGQTTEALATTIEEAQKRTAGAVEKGRMLKVNRLDAEKAFALHRNGTAKTYGLYVRPLDEEALLAADKTRAAIEAGRGKEIRGNEELRHEDNPFTKEKGRSYVEGYRPGVGAPVGGFSAADMVTGEFNLLSNPRARLHVQNVVWPTISHSWSLDEGALAGAIQKSRDTLGWALDNGLEGAFAKAGDRGKRFAQGLRRFSNDVTDISSAVDHGVARYFYGTTLGANVGALATNVWQPIVYTPGFVGVKHMLGGLADGVKEILAYAGARAGEKGLLLGPENHLARQRLMQGAFKHHELMGMSDDALEAIENLGLMRHLPAGRAGFGGAIDRVNETLLKGFQASEMFNRSVAANAFARKAAEDGLKEGSAEFKAYVRRGVEETQFGSTPFNTPVALLNKKNVFGRYATMRQYLGFAMRTATLPVVARRYSGIEAGGPIAALKRTAYLGRTAAVSAVVYEAGKNLFGEDLSGVGFTGGPKGLLRDYGPFSPFPAPPLVSGLGGFVMAALGEENKEDFKRTIPTYIPGGLALSRVLGLAPDLGQIPLVGDTVGLLQKQYVDWGKMQGGLAPVYKKDGTFVGWESGLQLAAKATGLDRFSFKDESEMTHYLLKNREAIQGEREKMIDALVKGDGEGAKGVADEFEKRYGWRLTVNKQDLARRQQRQMTPRVVRSLDRMPPELRAQMGWAQPEGPPAQVRSSKADEVGAQEAVQRFVQQERENAFQQNVHNTSSNPGRQ